MHTRTRRLVVAFVFACPPAVTLLSQAPAAPAPSARSQSGLNLASLNRSVDACTDFYQFACGGWLASNPIPADRPRWGRFDELQERNYEVLRRVLERSGGATDANAKKIGDYYA